MPSLNLLTESLTLWWKEIHPKLNPEHANELSVGDIYFMRDCYENKVSVGEFLQCVTDDNNCKHQVETYNELVNLKGSNE